MGYAVLSGIEEQMKRFFRYVRVGDFLILGIFLSLVVFSVVFFWLGPEGETVLCITDAGEQEVHLSKDGEYSLQGPLGVTVLEIKDGEARVKSSPCPDRKCVRMGKLGPLNPAIACVPNKIIIRLEGKDEQPDAITR